MRLLRLKPQAPRLGGPRTCWMHPWKKGEERKKEKKKRKKEKRKERKKEKKRRKKKDKKRRERMKRKEKKKHFFGQMIPYWLVELFNASRFRAQPFCFVLSICLFLCPLNKAWLSASYSHQLWSAVFLCSQNKHNQNDCPRKEIKGQKKLCIGASYAGSP